MSDRRTTLTNLPAEDADEIEREQRSAAADNSARRATFARVDAQRERMRQEGQEFDDEPLAQNKKQR